MKKWIAIAGLLFAVYFLTPVGAYFFFLRSENVALRNVKSQLKADGLPTTIAELFPDIPGREENAAPLLQQAAALIEKMPKDSPALRCVPGSSTEKSDTARLPEKDLSAIRSFLAEPSTQEALRLLSEAATKPHCYFARDYAQGAKLKIPDLAPMLSATRLLLNRSFCQDRDGDPKNALRGILTAMKISGFYENDPLLISWLFGASCSRMVWSTVTDLIGRHETIDPEELEVLENVIKTYRAHVRESLARALDGDRIGFGGAVFEDVLSGKQNLWEALYGGMPYYISFPEWQMKAVFWCYSYPARPLLVADYAAYLRFMTDLRKMVLRSKSQESDVTKRLEQIPRMAFLTRLSAISFGHILSRLQTDEAACDLALIGLRAEKFRAANARYPRDLAELAGSEPLPLDPFTGGAYIYKESDGNLLIYSVGPDHVDNGGNPKKVNRQSDIVWSIRRAAPNGASPEKR